MLRRDGGEIGRLGEVGWGLGEGLALLSPSSVNRGE